MTTSSPVAGPAGPGPARQRLRIDIWSDLGCPWCYLGKHRLETAIAASGHAGAIDLVPRSFELDPGTPHQARPVAEYLAAKMGWSPAQAAQMEAQLADLAQAEGLPFTGDRPYANSFDVHRVLHLAAAHGLAGELLGSLQRDLFGGRADVYGHDYLAGAAAGLGIDRARVEEVLAGDEYADAVRRDEADAGRLGITGVPFAVLDGRFAVPGASSVDGYARAIERAWAGVPT